jgi:hypothetical protein
MSCSSPLVPFKPGRARAYGSKYSTYSKCSVLHLGYLSKISLRLVTVGNQIAQDAPEDGRELLSRRCNQTQAQYHGAYRTYCTEYWLYKHSQRFFDATLLQVSLTRLKGMNDYLPHTSLIHSFRRRPQNRSPRFTSELMLVWALFDA